MPQHEYQTVLTITGQLSPQLIKSLKDTTGHLATIRKHTVGLGKESKKSFDIFEQSAKGAEHAADSLKDVMAELIAPIAAVTAGFASIKAVFGTLDDAAEKYKAMEDSVSQLRSTLAATDQITKHGFSLDKMMEIDADAAKQAGHQTGDMFSAGLYRGIEQKFAAGAGINPQFGLNKELFAAVPLMVARMQTGVTSVTSENSAAMAEALAQGIQTGRISREISGFDAAHLKAFKAGTIQQREQMLLQSRYIKDWKQYLAEQIREKPEEIKLMQLRLINDKDRIALGEKYLGIHEQIESLGLRVQDIFLNLLTDAITPMLPAIQQAMNAAEEGIKGIGSWVKWLFKAKSFSEFGTRLKDSIVNAITSVEGLWKLTFKNDDLKFVIDTFTGAVAGLHHALGDNIGNDIRALVAALAAWKGISLIGGFTQWLKNIGLLNVRAAVVNVNGPVAGAGAATTVENAGGLLSGAIALGVAAAPAVITAAAAAAAVNMLLRTTNKDPLQNNAVDISDRIAAENEAYIAAQKTLAIKFDSGNVDQEKYVAALKELDIQHKKQLEDLQKLRTSNDALIKSNADVGTSAMQAAQALRLITSQMGSFPMGGMGGGLSDQPGAVYEQYPSEGHAANYGPKGNKLGEGYGVGLGVAKQAQTGAHFGDKVRIDFSDGTSMVREVNETSERANGVEFFSNQQGEYSRHGAATVTKMASGGIIDRKTLAWLGEGGSREAVVPLNKGSLAKHGLGGSSYSQNINFSPVIHVGAGNEQFANEVASLMKDKFEGLLNDSYFEFQRRQLS